LEHHALDSSSQTADETAHMILSRLAKNEFRLI
jgi:hypothetical protein